ncbi:hypothetical protein IL992_30605 [Microbispora sp. NEAU-D428]|uniref:hypothetical protein n=1 Tax=Microbispora sitophila TaxID=2771537 RepID=UPI001867AFE7|nr:hypothetical protein [Microbispora sitophila]MBE3013496.1 hypothetical protein [Microbispora sitophila]
MTVKIAIIDYGLAGTAHAFAQAVAEGTASVEDLAWADASAGGRTARGTRTATTPQTA